MKSICIYCGSSTGNGNTYRDAAILMGETLAQEGISLVYGGGGIGLMGIVADTVIKNGGKVIGVIPRFLDERELSHSNLSELILVDTMHERKQIMADNADGFIAMPGGVGTFEEIFEAITWSQLKIHDKPCAFYNVNGFYDSISSSLDRAVTDGFINGGFRDAIYFESEPDTILTRFRTYCSPSSDKVEDALSQTARKQ